MDTTVTAPIPQSDSAVKNPKLHHAGDKFVKKMIKEPKNAFLLDHEEKTRERNISSISVLVKRLPEAKPGWPLLRRAVTANIEALKSSEARKMSVIHWAMKLPDRSLPGTKSQFDLVKELEIILELNSSSCKFFQYEELLSSTAYFSPGFTSAKQTSLFHLNIADQIHQY